MANQCGLRAYHRQAMGSIGFPRGSASYCDEAPSADAVACRCRNSTLRHTGHSHPLSDAFAPGTVRGTVAVCVGKITVAADGETWIERKPRIHSSTGLVQLAQPRQSSREMEMCDGKIPVCIDALAKPDDCFGIGSELHIGKANPYHPSMSHGVARRKAERLVDVRFGFCAPIKQQLREADKCMSAR